MTTDPISWSEKVADVRSKGVLGMQLYAIFTEPVGSMDAILDQMGPHLTYQKKLENEGILFAFLMIRSNIGKAQEWSS